MRPGYGAANDHASEHALNDYDFDQVIDNGGSLEGLYNLVDSKLEVEVH